MVLSFALIRLTRESLAGFALNRISNPSVNSISSTLLKWQSCRSVAFMRAAKYSAAPEEYTLFPQHSTSDIADHGA